MKGIVSNWLHDEDVWTRVASTRMYMSVAKIFFSILMCFFREGLCNVSFVVIVVPQFADSILLCVTECSLNLSESFLCSSFFYFLDPGIQSCAVLKRLAFTGRN